MTDLKKEVGENDKFTRLQKMEQIHPHSHKVNKFTHYSSSFYPPQRVFLLMREPRTSQ